MSTHAHAHTPFIVFSLLAYPVDAPGSIVSQLIEGVTILLHCDHRHCMPVFGVHYTDSRPPMFLFPRTKYGTLKHTLVDLQENGFRSRFNRVSACCVRCVYNQSCVLREA